MVTVGFYLVVRLVLAGAALTALVDCARRPEGAFTAYGKLSKPAWLGILAAALAIPWLFGFFVIVSTVAVIVYFVDVKPAVSR